MADTRQLSDVAEWAVACEPMPAARLLAVVADRCAADADAADEALEECLGTGRIVDVDGVLHARVG